jgi:hypothetical protein
VSCATVPRTSTLDTCTAALAGYATIKSIITANATANILFVIISLPPYFIWFYCFVLLRDMPI